jgi:hypothetical protein
MQRSTIVGVCVGLAVMLTMLMLPASRGPAHANAPASRGAPRAVSFEVTYAGWTREQLLAALEERTRVALARKNGFDGRFEPGNGPNQELDQLTDEIEWLTAATRSSSDP